MNPPALPNMAKRLTIATLFLLALLLVSMFFGLAAGSSGSGISALFNNLKGENGDELMSDIIWRLRFPRVILAVLLGATLSLGGIWMIDFDRMISSFCRLIKNQLLDDIIAATFPV